jgi:hypothetical protein
MWWSAVGRSRSTCRCRDLRPGSRTPPRYEPRCRQRTARRAPTSGRAQRTIDGLLTRPVGRVVVRDPAPTADEFARLASELYLPGVDAVVGWFVWLAFEGRRLLVRHWE